MRNLIELVRSTHQNSRFKMVRRFALGSHQMSRYLMRTFKNIFYFGQYRPQLTA